MQQGTVALCLPSKFLNNAPKISESEHVNPTAELTNDHPAGSAVGLRIGVIGTGQRAYIADHVAVSQTGARLTAAADITQAGRDRARAMFGSELAVFDSHTSLIEAEVVDAAIVTTPDWTHAEIAIDLLRAGIAVYLEKPLAVTIEEADAVLAVAHSTGTPLYVGHNFRHAAVVRLMGEIIQRGEIGEVKAVWVRHFVGNGGDYYFKGLARGSKQGELASVAEGQPRPRRNPLARRRVHASGSRHGHACGLWRHRRSPRSRR